MKKYFFYAAMAVATMASCTSEDDLTVDPVNPNPDAEEQVALNLGVATPAMTVGSRGTGMVGFVGTATDNATKASWDSQRLFVTMVNQSTNAVYYEPDGTPYFNNVEFRAPKNAVGNNNGLIRMYNNYTDSLDNGILEYKYYPVTGNYKFYGWHIDDAEAPTDSFFGKNTADADSATVSGIVINGTQDLLAANTEKIPETKPTLADAPYYAAANDMDVTTYETMVENQFSARTARNNFTPILNFKHTLARLKFHVKAGKGTDAALNYYDADAEKDSTRAEYEFVDSCWVDTTYTKAELAGKLNGAIYVTGIKVLNVNNNITLDLVNQKATATAAVDTFTLMSTPAQVNAANAGNPGWTDLTTKNLQELIAVAPKYATNYVGTKTPTDYKADEIGESIMFLPVNNPAATAEESTWGTDEIVKIQVQLGQCLIKTENEAETDLKKKYTYYWDTPKPVVLTLKANDIVKPNESQKWGDAGVFEAGKSYDVYITIYGRERIEVSANLVPWVDGGDIDTDIEDGDQGN